MAISRILSPEFLRAMIIYLSDIPEGSMDRLSSLCFVLHRMGFFMPRELLRER
jgi:hypothetical protein